MGRWFGVLMDWRPGPDEMEDVKLQRHLAPYEASMVPFAAGGQLIWADSASGGPLQVILGAPPEGLAPRLPVAAEGADVGAQAAHLMDGLQTRAQHSSRGVGQRLVDVAARSPRLVMVAGASLAATPALLVLLRLATAGGKSDPTAVPR